MSRMLQIMHHIVLCISCIAILALSHTCAFVIEPTEQEPQHQSKPLTLSKSKACPGASHQYSLTFLFNHYLCDMLECALSYRSCDGTAVTSWLSF
jgi:hypothetical protein